MPTDTVLGEHADAGNSEKKIPSKSEKDPKEYDTQLAIHSVQNILGTQEQTTLFEEKIDELEMEFGKLDGTIDRFGANLSDIESRVMEGLMKGFTQTNYKGNMPPKEVSESGELDKAISNPYRNIKELPRLRVTQSEIMKWCNTSKTSIGRKERIVNAIKFLGTTQFCFYYDRLAFDDDGKPVKLANGRWKKEPVTVVSTLFTIKEIKHDNSEKHSYYEITPSTIFLDQRENYFIMLRNNWREEVVQLVGKRKASSYTFRFLMFLCYQYELKRRSPSSQKPYQIRWKPEDIATAIKMPASVVKKNKKRMNSILDDAYSVAGSVGYLEKYERLGHLDCLLFDEAKYYDPSRSIFNEAVKTMAENKSASSKIEKYLFDAFHKVKQSIDRGYCVPEEGIQKKDLAAIREVLKSRSAQDVEKLINWGMKKPFWCTQINTLEKLKRNFSNAWMEMCANKKTGNSIENKEWALELKVRLGLMGAEGQMQFEALNNDLEIGVSGHPAKQCFSYKEKEFKKIVTNYLKKLSKACSFNVDEILEF